MGSILFSYIFLSACVLIRRVWGRGGFSICGPRSLYSVWVLTILVLLWFAFLPVCCALVSFCAGVHLLYFLRVRVGSGLDVGDGDESSRGV